MGVFPNGATPETGLQDMAGNVWEWTATPGLKGMHGNPPWGLAKALRTSGGWCAAVPGTVFGAGRVSAIASAAVQTFATTFWVFGCVARPPFDLCSLNRERSDRHRAQRGRIFFFALLPVRDHT